MTDNCSSSGVRNLRAKFEATTDTTSPPSRGRSPAASDTSRPRSKVRTSFVSVDPSGQQGPQLGQRKASSSNGDSLFGVDGAHESKTTPFQTQAKISPAEVSPVRMAQPVESNGNSIAETEHSPPNGTMHSATIPSKGPNGTLPTEPASQTHETSNTNPDKPVSSAEDETASLKPGDPKDADAVSGGSALSPATENLGQLLKGSPFQVDSQESRVTSVPATSSASEPPASPSKAKPQATATKQNGKPRGASSGKPASTATAKASGTRPSNISTSRNGGSASNASKPTAAGKTPTTPKTPHTPKTPNTSERKPSSTTQTPKQSTRSPRQHVSSGGSLKEPSKESTKEKPSRFSMATKASTAAASKPRQSSASVSANVNKKATTISPPSNPRPRSPTRPVRLPASATAPTAASAAKVAGGPPSRSPSRASIGSNLGRKPSTLIKNRTVAGSRGPPSGQSANLGRKTSRPSLPAPSNGPEKPKSRTSTGAPKAADEGFLARMMRPTASSASKTHEKVEAKTPPKKQHLFLRPKRKSAVNEEETAKLSEQHDEEVKGPAEEQENVSMAGDVEGSAEGFDNTAIAVE